ncbi:putative alcohol dehydrogenase [Pestalotiopsis sp. NC0098]|nr:putative alcohol dehydrogenase [Pestalotiopsis sp. NC0098]
MFRAIIYTFGPPADVVACELYEPLVPGSGQVRIRMTMAAINPSDLITISGAYQSRITLPFVPGFEGVGVIEAVGSRVQSRRPGQRVLALGSAGAWQEFKVTEERWCFPVPEDISDQQAAMAYINPLTALNMVREFAPPASSAAPVAVNAATSAIGQMIIRLLNRAGLRPIAVIRRLAGREHLFDQLKVSAVLCGSDTDLSRKLLEITGGRGLAVAWDAVGRDEGTILARSLSRGGTLIQYGLLSGTPLSTSIYSECPEIRIVLYHLRDWVHTATRSAIENALGEAFELIREGCAASKVAAIFPLSAINDALEFEAKPGRQGNVLLSI